MDKRHIDKEIFTLEKDYSNREIDYWREETREQLTRIETQVTKTNGRVSALENWRWMLIGGMTVILTIVIPLAIYVFKTSVMVKDIRTEIK